jgi:hypothetical protein
MSETLEKLRPDRDLQCYFLRPSAIAAFSETSANGYTVSGAWRQQFDWAVIEWNRDNVFEHPAFRSLPDGDLSGLTLVYEETRENCIPLDSDLYPTVDWPNLRVWADDGTGEHIYKVPLKDYATAIEGSYVAATGQFTLGGAVTIGDYVGIAFLSEHYPYLMLDGDTVEVALEHIVGYVNGFSTTMTATRDGATITLTYVGAGDAGANGNIVGAYTFVSGARTETWDPLSRQFTGGTSPSKWRFTLPFISLSDPVLGTVPATAIRKLRWTYSAAFQSGEFVRSEFQVVVSNWAVTGTGRTYLVAGRGSRRIENDSDELTYTGTWARSLGNFSGGAIHATTAFHATVSCTYAAAHDHTLYLGTRLAENGTEITIAVDSGTPYTFDLNLDGEDVLIRQWLGEFGPGAHTVQLEHHLNDGKFFYFDFLELAVPTTDLPVEITETKLAAATDWDTDHSIALAPERTAWLIHSLGLTARVNHYVGALWFYELTRVGHVYASATITFAGASDDSLITQLILGRTDHPLDAPNIVEHLNLIGDTVESLAKAFELELNRGYTGVRAQASGNQLTIYSRSMGLDGTLLTISTSEPTEHLTIEISEFPFANGADGDWRTDLEATPRINRAARDWARSFFVAIKNYDMDGVAAFSMELQHGDPSPEVGIAQRYPSLAPVLLTTPALQTNFSPASIDFWKQVYLDMANVMDSAGLQPYLQFGEVQWWYKPDDGSGMPFYDAYTTTTFHAEFGHDLAVITSNTTDPATVPDEAEFLPALIGSFTSQVRSHVHAAYSNCRFEVLYPIDVNAPALNHVINYPLADWTPGNLECLKTESFNFTYARNLDLSQTSIDASAGFGFPPSKRSHLVGAGDASASWMKEARLAEASGLESVVLFALDQLCLIGYQLPLSRGLRSSTQLG